MVQPSGVHLETVVADLLQKLTDDERYRFARNSAAKRLILIAANQPKYWARVAHALKISAECLYVHTLARFEQNCPLTINTEWAEGRIPEDGFTSNPFGFDTASIPAFLRNNSGANRALTTEA